MKRADVQIGTEYAVRRGSYGEFARVLIRGETTKAVQSGRSWSTDRTRRERGFEGKVIQPALWGGFGTKGAIVFVRGRDISHAWEVETSRREAEDRLAAERESAKRVDENERRALAAKMKALGITDHGLRILVDGYRYTKPDEQVRINRTALAALIDRASA